MPISPETIQGHLALQVAEARAEFACPERSRRVKAWERELNALVYELYGSIEEEIGIQEGQSDASTG